MLRRAVFRAGLRRYQPPPGAPPWLAAVGGDRAEAWRPRRTCYYFINDDAPVSFALDVSEVYEKKRQALRCHATQFAPVGEGSVTTRLTDSTFFQLIESRDAKLGALTGVRFAEGIVVREPLLRTSLFEPRSVR